jgi:hypothetical protein
MMVSDNDYDNFAHTMGISGWKVNFGIPSKMATRTIGGGTSNNTTPKTPAPKKAEAKKDWSKYKRN